jgi:hypothetical protein
LKEEQKKVKESMAAASKQVRLEKEQRWSVSPKAMVIKMPSPNFFFLSLLCPIGETVDQLREIAGLQETLLRASQDGARNGNRSHRAGNRNSCIAINFLCAV